MNIEEFNYECAVVLIENFQQMRAQGIVLNEYEQQLYEETSRTITIINRYKRKKLLSKLRNKKEG